MHDTWKDLRTRIDGETSFSNLENGRDGGVKGSWKHPVRIMITDLEELGGLTHLFPVFVLVGPEIFVLLHHAFEEFPPLFVNSHLVRVYLLGSYSFNKFLSNGEGLFLSSLNLAWDIW